MPLVAAPPLSKVEGQVLFLSIWFRRLCSATSNFSRSALRHVYFSRGDVRFEKLRNTELRERGKRSKGLLTGLLASQLRRLQSVLNAAARLIHLPSRYEHVTPMLQELHWLRSPERIDFKLAVLVYRCLHGLAPRYLSDYIQRVANSNRRRLRSSSSSQLVIRRTRLSTVGDRAFPVAGSRLWNSLPPDVTSAPTLTTDCFSKPPQNLPFLPMIS